MKTAFVFPGQGAQFVGMGKDLFDSSPIAQEIYELANKITAEFNSGADEKVQYKNKVSDISFTGPEEELKRTLYTQPGILALSLSLAKLSKEKIQNGELGSPAFVAGHSLGEFAALYMADVLSLEDTIKLVSKRAQLMEAAPAGAMTAVVGLEESKLNEFVDQTDGCSVANYNSPDQIVITGTADGVAKVGELASKHAEDNSLRVKVIPLAVGGAFHSPLMKAASEEFAKLIDAAQFNDAKIPVIQNFAGEAVTSADEIKANLKKQMTGSVQWTKTVKVVLENKVETVIELGPGKVLAGLFKKQDRRFPVKSIGNFEDFKSLSLVEA